MTQPNMLKAIWASVRDIERHAGLDKEDAKDVLRRVVKEVTGQPSTRALNNKNAVEVIRRLKSISDPTSEPPRRETITPDQQKGLSQTREALKMTPAGYAAFCKRMLKGRPWPQSREEAGKVFEGLKALMRRRYPPAHLSQHAHALLQLSHVSPQDQGFLRTVITTARRRRSMSCGQIGICLRIGERYERPIPARERVSDPS